MTLAKQMAVFFLMMLMGMIARKRNYITEDNIRNFSAIVVDIANPALILYGSIAGTGKIPLRTFGFYGLVAVGVFAFFLLMGLLFDRVFGNHEKVYSLMLVFSNIGFMGMPLVRAMYGENALIYVTLFEIPFNLLIYTYGVLRLSGTKKQGAWKKTLNIGTIVSVLAVALYFTEIRFPDVIIDTTRMLSDITAPLSMMIIGASIPGILRTGFVKDRRLLLFTVLKMFLLPAAGMLILSSILTDKTFIGVCFIMIAAPAASMNTMMAAQYGTREDFETATKGVALTTVVSLFSIPLLALVLGY